MIVPEEQLPTKEDIEYALDSMFSENECAAPQEDE